MFWHSWFGMLKDQKRVFQYFLTMLSLTVAYTSLQVLLLLLFVAYYYFASPYLGASWGLFIIYELFLSMLPWLLSKDYALMAEKGQLGSAQEISFPQACVLFVTLFANSLMTLVALIDLQ